MLNKIKPLLFHLPLSIILYMSKSFGILYRLAQSMPVFDVAAEVAYPWVEDIVEWVFPEE